MRIQCTQGCNAILDVKLPAHPQTVVVMVGQLSTIPTEAEQLAAIRDEVDRALGHAITEAMLAHTLFDCPVAAARDADCGATSPMGYTCNLNTGHGGDVHEHHALHPGQPPEADDHLVASWPVLQVVHGG